MGRSALVLDVRRRACAVVVARAALALEHAGASSGLALVPEGAAPLMVEEDEDDEMPIESGPFCRHFSDPTACEIVCEACGHTCAEHDQGGKDEGACRVDNCECTDWWEPPEPD